jgi:Fe-S-cluster-containing dehydrogenase component
MQTPQEGTSPSGEANPSLQVDLSGNVVNSGKGGARNVDAGGPSGPGTVRISRRWFLAVGSATGAAVAAGFLLDTIRRSDATVSSQASVILVNAKGVLIADPTRCVGCRRCELACTEYNKGKSQPTISNIKIARNINFGAKSASSGYETAMGMFGNHRVVQDTCKQCPHPVPCATTCPQNAIGVDQKTFARVVDESKCVGCQFCQMACPWEMMSFDAETKKAQKCHLCGGNPECVAACPTGAIKYVAWTDMTAKVPARAAITGLTRSTSNDEACGTCHK